MTDRLAAVYGSLDIGVGIAMYVICAFLFVTVSNNYNDLCPIKIDAPINTRSVHAMNRDG